MQCTCPEEGRPSQRSVFDSKAVGEYGGSAEFERQDSDKLIEEGGQSTGRRC